MRCTTIISLAALAATLTTPVAAQLRMTEQGSGRPTERHQFAVNGGAGLSLRLLGASAFIEAKLNNVYTDKKFISNKS